MEYLKDFLIPGKIVTISVSLGNMVRSLNAALGPDVEINKGTLDNGLLIEIYPPSGKILILNLYNFSESINLSEEVMQSLVQDIKIRALKERIPAIIIDRQPFKGPKRVNNKYVYQNSSRYITVWERGTICTVIKDVSGLLISDRRLMKDSIHAYVVGWTASGKSSLMAILSKRLREEKGIVTWCRDGELIPPKNPHETFTDLFQRHGKVNVKFSIKSETKKDLWDFTGANRRDLHVIFDDTRDIPVNEIKRIIQENVIELLDPEIFDVSLIGLLNDAEICYNENVIPADLTLTLTEIYAYEGVAKGIDGSVRRTLR